MGWRLLLSLGEAGFRAGRSRLFACFWTRFGCFAAPRWQLWRFGFRLALGHFKNVRWSLRWKFFLRSWSLCRMWSNSLLATTTFCVRHAMYTDDYFQRVWLGSTSCQGDALCTSTLNKRGFTSVAYTCLRCIWTWRCSCKKCWFCLCYRIRITAEDADIKAETRLQNIKGNMVYRPTCKYAKLKSDLKLLFLFKFLTTSFQWLITPSFNLLHKIRFERRWENAQERN